MSGSAERRPGEDAILRLLLRQGHIGADDVSRLESIARESGCTIHEVLAREQVITDTDLAFLLASTLHLRLIDLTSFPLDPQVVRSLKEAVATRYEVVPIRVDDTTIEIATANPLDRAALKAVEFATGRRVIASVATHIEIRDALAHAYRLQESLEQFLQHVPPEEALSLAVLPEEGNLSAIARDAELPPVIKLSDLILAEGVKSRASDVHVEPCADAVVVRYRRDGMLEESFRFPKWLQNPLTARLKIMAALDITERRVPQDGRIRMRYQNRVIDLRVSSLPAQHGEKITFRILDATQAMHALDRIGLCARDLQSLRDAAKRPQGMILVTGPTGSGKTTTLYALLLEIFSPNINIVSIENPIEYQLKGINQVEVNPKQGLTFASVLRSVLRQDPDVILVGEIRDRETAEVAFQAAQTGHLVLSTVHTNDAAGAVSRLLDLGLEPYAMASALNVIVAQRLVRRVCRKCSAEWEPDEDSRRQLRLPQGLDRLRRATGCATCRNTGYVGRTGVYEVFSITPTVAKLIESGAGESAIRQQARADDCRGVLEDAVEKLASGMTTREEVQRVVQLTDDSARCPACAKEISDDYSVCPHCSHVLRSTCAGCAKPLSAQWVTCPYCGVSTGAAFTRSPALEKPALRAHARSFKALVVDDGEMEREIVRAALEGSDLALGVTLCASGAEALAAAAKERPDVVILDISMPEMDGFEVCRRLRSDVRTAFVPVLMLTAHDREDFTARGFGVGADDYIVKPVPRDALIARVRRMLERTYGAEAVTGVPFVVALDDDCALPAAGDAARLEEVVRQLEQSRTELAALAQAVRTCNARVADLTARLDANGTSRTRSPDPRRDPETDGQLRS